jgi:transcriptional regulator with XRE-family HTH domain
MVGKKNIRLKTEELQKLGSNIKIYREKASLSQEDLAMYAGLHRTFISSVERGKYNISFVNLLNIASSLNITLETLLEGIKPGKPEMSAKLIRLQKHFDDEKST